MFLGCACSRGGGGDAGRLHSPGAVHQGAVPHSADGRLPHQPGSHQDANQSNWTHRQGITAAAAARHHPRTPAGLSPKQKCRFEWDVIVFVLQAENWSNLQNCEIKTHISENWINRVFSFKCVAGVLSLNNTDKAETSVSVPQRLIWTMFIFGQWELFALFVPGNVCVYSALLATPPTFLLTSCGLVYVCVYAPLIPDAPRSLRRAMTTQRAAFARPVCSVWWLSTLWLVRSSNPTWHSLREARYWPSPASLSICMSSQRKHLNRRWALSSSHVVISQLALKL